MKDGGGGGEDAVYSWFQKIMTGWKVGAGGFAAPPLVIHRGPQARPLKTKNHQVSDYHRSEVEQTKF